MLDYTGLAVRIHEYYDSHKVLWVWRALLARTVQVWPIAKVRA